MSLLQWALFDTGSVCLQPTCAVFWALLGDSLSEMAQREYALSRALQLDPKLVTAWTLLGRMYVETGDTSLADACFMHARSHEPTAPAVWEGMGSLAALSKTGRLSAQKVILTDVRNVYRKSPFNFYARYICSFETETESDIPWGLRHSEVYGVAEPEDSASCLVIVPLPRFGCSRGSEAHSLHAGVLLQGDRVNVTTTTMPPGSPTVRRLLWAMQRLS